MGKNSPANAGDTGSVPGPEDSPHLGAAKSMCHSYSGLHTLGPVSHNQ